MIYIERDREDETGKPIRPGRLGETLPWQVRVLRIPDPEFRVGGGALEAVKDFQDLLDRHLLADRNPYAAASRSVVEDPEAFGL